MTLSEYRDSLQEEQVNAILAVAKKSTDITDEDKETFVKYIKTSSEALGEDQIAEPIRYIVASMGGLRGEDLKALIGEDFNADTFDEWNNLLGEPVLAYRNLPGNNKLYDIAPQMREKLRADMGDGNFRSCASDIGYYFIEHKEAGDILRDTQTMHLLLDGGEAAAAAEYISQAEGEPLRIATNILGNALKDGPEYVQNAVWDMLRAQGEKIDLTKMLLLLLNDCVAIIGIPDRQKVVIEKLQQTIGELIAEGHNDITILLGVARLRTAQNARVRRQEQEAQTAFIGAMNYLMPPLQQADPNTISPNQIDEYWLCLKICQEMAQPKAMAIFFEQIIKVEKAQTQNTNLSEEQRGRIAENIIGQHIDMSKTYYMMPKPLQEQFTNYSESTVALLKAYLEQEEGQHNEDVKNDADISRLAGYYQALGELTLHLERYDESNDALTEAQILQMRQLAAAQKADGENVMSPNQLMIRLALSVTNHMLAGHYRRQGKNSHDLGIVLKSNMNLAEDCFKFYSHDGRVIHFIINAALELGDYQHNMHGYLAECGTYEKVIRLFPALNNMRLDGQLAQDIAMIETKCGQIQADNSIRRYKDAIRNLEAAYKLWKALADNTKNPNIQKNAEAVEQMLKQLKK